MSEHNWEEIAKEALEMLSTIATWCDCSTEECACGTEMQQLAARLAGKYRDLVLDILTEKADRSRI